ncbi:MAG TPA: hypothetical protein VFQ61_16005 [Polyangiaceae bacterium]|nr:hypothetical protein [Polyangiaceae bacterium]
MSFRLFGAAVGSRTLGLALFEARLSRRLWGFVEPTFGHYRERNEYNVDNPNIQYPKGNSTSLGVDVGVRWIANPGGAVEVGLYHGLRHQWAWSTRQERQIEFIEAGNPQFGNAETSSKTYGAEFATGLVVERELIPHLWLRIQSSLLSARYEKTRFERTTSEPRSTFTSGESLDLGIRINPMLKLRVSW